jgi:hypothetical protein
MQELKLYIGVYQLQLGSCCVQISVHYAARSYSVAVLGCEVGSEDHVQALEYAANFAAEAIASKSSRNFFDAKYLHIVPKAELTDNSIKLSNLNVLATTSK